MLEFLITKRKNHIISKDKLNTLMPFLPIDHIYKISYFLREFIEYQTINRYTVWWLMTP